MRGPFFDLGKETGFLCDIVDYNYDLIKWDINAFVGSPSKQLFNTHLQDYKFTPLKKGLKNTIKYYEDSINSSK